MTVITSEHVGRVWVPELSRVVIGPVTPQGVRQSRYCGIVSYKVRHWNAAAQRYDQEERGWGIAMAQLSGLATKWQQSEELRYLFPTPELFVRAVRGRMFIPQYSPRQDSAFAHNERIQNGGRMLAKVFWGAASSPNQSTVAVPSFVALNNNAAFTVANFTFAHCGNDQSLGNGATNTASGITTNEFTTAGLARAAGTVAAFADQTALDGVFTLTVSKTFTCTSGPQTNYGAALVDAASTTVFNLFAEAPYALVTTQTNDTDAVTWNISA